MKYIQDPIHGAISIEKRIMEVIDHKAFQRLRKIKALGFLEMVFPSAKHSRFEHSIGAMYVLDKLINEGIENTKSISAKWSKDSEYKVLTDFELNHIRAEREFYLLAALLHDVGHGPFSHASEDLMPTISSLLKENEEPEFVKELIKKLYKDKIKADHEVYTILIISKILREIGFKEIEIKKVLAFKTGYSDDVSEMKSLVKLIAPLIDGEFDCDRMDYLIRDSYFCGVPYGRFDFDRIAKGICFLKHKEICCVGFKRKSLSALEDFIFSRFQMHSQVYTHKVDVSCNQSFKRIADSSNYVLPSKLELYIEINDTNLIEKSDGSLEAFSSVINERKLWPIVFESFNQHIGNESIIMDLIKSHLNESEYSIKSTDKLFKKPSLLNLPIVIENIMGDKSATKISGISQLLSHYNGSFSATRMFVHPNKFAEVNKCLKALSPLIKEEEAKALNVAAVVNDVNEFKKIRREKSDKQPKALEKKAKGRH